MKARAPDAFAAVADPTRREILGLLRDRGLLTAGEIAAEFPVSRAAVSKHLGVLLRAKLVRARARGREMDYRLAGRGVRRLAGDVRAGDGRQPEGTEAPSRSRLTAIPPKSGHFHDGTLSSFDGIE